MTLLANLSHYRPARCEAVRMSHDLVQSRDIIISSRGHYVGGGTVAGDTRGHRVLRRVE